LFGEDTPTHRCFLWFDNKSGNYPELGTTNAG
jgi:hypothetical protein